MLRTDIESLRRHVEVVVEEQMEVTLVYLFGSQATGEVGPLSDVDLAVLLAPGAPVAQIRSRLAHAFSAALEGAAVDLVILNRAPIELAYAVIAQGELFYERDRAGRIEYEADVMSRYGDYLPYLRMQRQEILEGVGDERRVRRYREALGRTQRASGAPGPSPRQTSN
jgi:predicted nucleotidyltransferase